MAGKRERRTDELAKRLAALDLDVPAQIAETLRHLEPKDRADVLMELMQFLYPKRKAIEVIDETPKAPQPFIVEFVDDGIRL